ARARTARAEPDLHPVGPVRGFGGSEPLVGEIVGLRTFRVDASGALLPLYSGGVWYDGENTATCSPPTGHHGRPAHAVPDDDCECGFYAYGSATAARQNRNTRHVQAVVSCWGSVVAGTQGVRAQHARIDAVWLSPRAPQWLRRRVAVRYPSARLYTDADAMLAEHPLTPLPCYEQRRPRRFSAVALGALLLAILTLGALPATALHVNNGLWLAWLVTTCAVGLLAAWLAVGVRTAGHGTAAGITLALFSWLVAPAFGLTTGLVLRAWPMLGLLRVAVAWVDRVRPWHFPVVAITGPETIQRLWASARS
uniref:hypothetical protein n=1 Tax=uncultured Jatrophihabitans sp. TaxID=1610747 RepID=UPI0035C99CEC